MDDGTKHSRVQRITRLEKAIAAALKHDDLPKARRLTKQWGQLWLAGAAKRSH